MKVKPKRQCHECRTVGQGRTSCPTLGRGERHRLPLARAQGLPAHKIGRLWKFQLSEIDEWVRAGRANLEHLYAPKVDGWALYDNAGAQPVLLDWSEKA